MGAALAAAQAQQLQTQAALARVTEDADAAQRTMRDLQVRAV